MIFPRVAAVGAAAFLFGCAPRSQLLPSNNIPDVVHLTNVPFFSNTSDQCGPAALASVLNYWGKSISPAELKSEVYLPRQRGTLPMDMRPAVTNHGLSAQVISGSFDDIKRELHYGRPVIAYLDFGTRKHPIGHFVVVTGFDDARHGLYVHSGPAKDKFASYRRFNRGWKDTDHWMLVAGPSDSNVIRRDARQPQVHAVATEESLMELGNEAFEKKDYATAEEYYRRVLDKNPSHGGANNNLAMVYLMMGRDLDQAEKFAREAAATAEYRPYADDTLAQIQARREHLH